ncbi:MFS transporter [Renibacterium salmoninarum ATCC 33209]|uniref:MFS transporter n=2 Tax=Renibacterium salmoninarum TaxID=1646 RepID=A9WL65_RENSM|nr:MFS transporter [Renibacterium salmoninarum]ABY21898.1 MFS transporter [Renibacterium salmoninarum ATCC 33209]
MTAKKLIMSSRALGALAFALLALNAFSADQQLWAIYALGAFDAFVGSLAVTALMAVTPTLVPRDKLAAAGALNMLTVRLGTMVSPAVGGVVIAAWGVGWNYSVGRLGYLPHSDTAFRATILALSRR